MLPLDDRTIELFGARFRDRSPHPSGRHYTYRPRSRRCRLRSSAALGGRSWDLSATVERPAGAGGVLYASGNENSGLSLFVEATGWCSTTTASVSTTWPSPTGGPGRRLGRRRPVPALGPGGRRDAGHRRQECGTVGVPFVMRMISSVGASVGYDHGSPVSRRYNGENPFDGTLAQVDIALVAGGRRESDEAAATDERATMARQ